ncbi:patatin-like phospholipase domain-containing protein 2 [Salvelinus fontinalis]|uniref:patatin-like phospholipase domain-containing protein 2 n=1 Tax=Salvelinus fontinalis TaxID=8038 RepID=UPI002486886B|nr:patatin-like phospholipase domain-containing protein 2 [Salvelinus fontinalis]
MQTVCHADCLCLSLCASVCVCAVLTVCHADMMRDEMLRFALQRRGPLQPAGNVFVWIEGLLRRSLPDDAHIRASGRLAVVMTRIPDGQNTVVSEFTSREDVVQALLCSCFIPGYHGIQPPSYKGVHYVDGGLSSIQPTHSSPYAHTLTVSPFAGEADICPPDPGSMYVIVMSGMPLNCSVANVYRILEALYPYNWEALDKAYHSGYSDGLHFLHTSDLVPCLPLLNTPSEHQSSPPDGWTDLETDWEEAKDVEEEKEQIETRQEKIKREEKTKEEKEEEEEEGEDEEEEEEEEEEEWSSLTETRGDQRNYSLEGGDLPWNLTTPELAMYLALPTWIHTALICNIMGLLWTHTPMRGMSYMLLPFTLPLSFILGNVHRLVVLGFWMWQDLRQITFFIINTLVSSLHRNLEDRNLQDR